MNEIFYQIDTSKFPKERVERYKTALKKRYDCPVWQTQDNRCIPVEKMRDSHLVNSMRFKFRQMQDAMDSEVVGQPETRVKVHVCWKAIQSLQVAAYKTQRMDLIFHIYDAAWALYQEHLDPYYFEPDRHIGGWF